MEPVPRGSNTRGGQGPILLQDAQVTFHAGACLHRPQASLPWGLTAVLIISTSEEPGSQPEHSPSRCSVSSKRPSLHGLGKRHGLHQEDRQARTLLSRVPWTAAGTHLLPRTALYWETSKKPRPWGLGCRGMFPILALASMILALHLSSDSRSH